MIVDLTRYLQEVNAIVLTAEEFVAADSIARLKRLPVDLGFGLESSAPKFKWATDRTRPIKLRPASAYDKRDGLPPPLLATFGFEASFDKSVTSRAKRARKLARIEGVSTHIKIYRDGQNVEDDAELPVLHLHVDKKDEAQLGPYVHIQVSEKCTERLGMRLAVPRMPFTSCLPTDCLDFALAEFFPRDWSKAQAGAYNFNLWRDAQLARAVAMAAGVLERFEENKKRSPVSILQDFWLAEDVQRA